MKLVHWSSLKLGPTEETRQAHNSSPPSPSLFITVQSSFEPVWSTMKHFAKFIKYKISSGQNNLMRVWQQKYRIWRKIETTGGTRWMPWKDPAIYQYPFVFFHRQPSHTLFLPTFKVYSLPWKSSIKIGQGSASSEESICRIKLTTCVWGLSVCICNWELFPYRRKPYAWCATSSPESVAIPLKPSASNRVGPRTRVGHHRWHLRLFQSSVQQPRRLARPFAMPP